MAYRDAFEEIVKLAVVSSPKLHHLWLRREKFNSFGAVQELCGKGQGPFDNADAVLAYCMLYMHAHYEAIKKPLAKLVKTLEKASAIAMLDMGSGPMTAALAFSDMIIEKFGSPPRINYIGIDISNEMTAIANQFSKRTDCFQPRGYIRFEDGIERVSDKSLEKWANGATHMVVTCSYIMSQSRLSREALAQFVELLVRIKKLSNGRDIWIAYTNANTTSKFTQLRDLCRTAGIVFEKHTLTVTDHPVRQHRLERGRIEVIPSNPWNLQFLATRLR